MTLLLQYVCHQAKLAMVLEGKTQNPFFNRCIMKGLCKVFKVAHLIWLKHTQKKNFK